MKEIMIPYLILCWLLLKFKIVAPTTKNYVIMTGLGLFLALSLFTAHRYFSPSDLTLSTTVRAPRAVLSPEYGYEIKEIFVTHNALVKKGQILYTLVDDKRKAQEFQAQEDLRRAKINAIRLTREYKQKKRLKKGAIALIVLDAARDEMERAEAAVITAKANLEYIRFELRRLSVPAPFDGQVSHINVANGSRIGALHIWDIKHKFIVMRIPDQAYAFVKPGQFAEFYVDAYPGHIFRAKVHSITGATGESEGSIYAQEEHVAKKIEAGSASVGRTVILTFKDPEGINVPIGATGSAWISAEKPPLLGFMDIIGAATIRLYAAKAYLGAF